MEQNYIQILIQSLQQKLKALDIISQENAKQKELLRAEELDTDAFEATVDAKAEQISQIEFLDSGFQKMYDHVKKVLEEQKQEYRDEIMTLKKLVTQVTEKTVDVQREEQENRNLAEQQFSGMRKKVRQIRNTQQAAKKYYNSMAKLNFVDPQLMDKKK